MDIKVDVPIVGQNPDPDSFPKRHYKPTHDWIVLHKRPLELKSRGGILLPHGPITGSEKTPSGTQENEQAGFEWIVVECGPGRTTEAGQVIPMACKPGDAVDFVGKAVPKSLDGKEVFWLVRNDVLTGIVERVAQEGTSN